MSFPRYPEYKDSGVEWLGEVPAAWNVYPVKRGFMRKKELNTGMRCENRLSLTMRGVVPRDLDDLDGLQASEFETYQVFHENDLAFKLIDLQNIKTSRVGLVPETGIMSPAYIRLEPNRNRISPRFAYWFFTDLYNRQIFNQLGGGVRQTLGPEELGTLPFPFVSLNDQVAIATFLDHETAKIDALVAEQEKLVALLKEKRQAVVSRAVTKGLDPNAPMKDSGIEWLGEVPEHWEVGPLKHFAEIVDCKHHTVQFLDDGWPIVSIRELRNDRIELADAKLTSQDEWDFLRDGRIPQRGDMIFCRNASVGAVGYVDFDEPFCMGQDVCLIRPDSTSRFMHFQLTSALIRNQIEALLVGATIRRANVEEIRGLLVAHPPADEQDAITKFLEMRTAEFDALSADAEVAVALLKERRSALISAAVTGKIDVREFA
jgi:type I restriction enzyme S subunit